MPKVDGRKLGLEERSGRRVCDGPRLSPRYDGRRLGLVDNISDLFSPTGGTGGE